MLHVAGQSFYDEVLGFINDAAAAAPRSQQTTDTQQSLSFPASCATRVVVLTEGIIEDETARATQAQEYEIIRNCEEIRQRLSSSAEANTMYSEAVQREICEELELPWERLYPYLAVDKKTPIASSKLAASVRLQECYFKPLLATVEGVEITNADVTENDLVAAYWDSCGGPSCGNPRAAGLNLATLGREPHIRTIRDRHCVGVAKRLLDDHATDEPTSSTASSLSSLHIVIPWGFYHVSPLEGLLDSELITTSSRNPFAKNSSLATLSYNIPTSVAAVIMKS